MPTNVKMARQLLRKSRAEIVGRHPVTIRIPNREDVCYPPSAGTRAIRKNGCSERSRTGISECWVPDKF